MLYGSSIENSWVQLSSALFLGLYLQQVAFMGHDLGHNSVTHINKYDNYIGLIIGNFMSGIALGWWKDSHNTHHVVPNSVLFDPDIQHLPFLAISNKFFSNPYSFYH